MDLCSMRRVCLTGILFAVLASSARAGASYAITDLSTLGGTGSWAYDVNNHGDIVGFSYPEGNPQYHAFLWRDGAMIDLGTMGKDGSKAFAINDSCQVVGELLAGNFWTAGPFLWENGAMLIVPGAVTRTPRSVNVRGEVAPAMVSLLAPGYNGFGSAGGLTFAINDTRQVAGIAIVGAGYRPFLHTAGEFQDLGTLGGQFCDVKALSNLGNVVGSMETGVNHQRGAYVFRDGALQKLPGLPVPPEGSGHPDFPVDTAAAINERGQIVGTSTPIIGDPRAVLWEDGQVLDLNSTITATTAWRLASADGINEAGQIVGSGFFSGIRDGRRVFEVHGYLLTPLGSVSPAQALRVAAGLCSSGPVEMAVADVEPNSAPRIDMADAVRLLRRARDIDK